MGAAIYLRALTASNKIVHHVLPAPGVHEALKSSPLHSIWKTICQSSEPRQAHSIIFEEEGAGCFRSVSRQDADAPTGFKKLARGKNSRAK